MEDSNKNLQTVNFLELQQNQSKPLQNQEQKIQQPAKKKMSKKEKIVMCVGISLVLLVLLFAFVTLGVPQIIGQVKHCSPFAEQGNHCGTLGLGMIGMAGLIFIGIPIVLIGATMILYGILSWKKVKNPGFMTFLIMVMVTLLLGSAIVSFLFLPLIL